MKTLENSLRFGKSDPAKFRLHVLEHYYKYGWKPTVEAFKVGKSTLYDWKREYELSGKKLLSLVPKRHVPNVLDRWRQTGDWCSSSENLESNMVILGKRKLAIFLDEYARELGVLSISSRTISKVIKRKNLYFDHPKRHKRKNKFSRERTRKSPRVKAPGYVEMDSVVVYIDYQRHNFMCCIDIYTKFAHVRKVKTLSSLQAKITFQQFQLLSCHKIHTVQTDNGSEFFKTFHQYLDEEQIKHQFIYPKSPKINGVVERFNRTVQEEFINRSDEIYFDLEAFQVKLTGYLDWYNYKTTCIIGIPIPNAIY